MASSRNAYRPRLGQADNLPGEEWREVESAPEYAVSSYGRVKRLASNKGTSAGRLLRQNDFNGYKRVAICRNGAAKTTAVHRLVCFAFHGNPPSPIHIVAHGDSNPSNNRADNLRWATPLENEDDKRQAGRNRVGDRNHFTKLGREQVLEIRASTLSANELAAKYNVSPSNVHLILRRVTWSHI